MPDYFKHWLFSLALLCLVQITWAQKNILPATTVPTPEESDRYKWQKSNKDFFTRMVQFSELSWVSGPFMDYGSDKGTYILSADIQPAIFVGGERMRFAVNISPRYKVRIFRDDEGAGDSSLPVRTPSFMPGATVYIPLSLGSHNVYKNIKYISIAGFHHSNGQDHSTFKPSGEFNFYNGNFSTNYLELGINFNWRRKKDQRLQYECRNVCNDFNTGYEDCLAKIAIEQHFGTADAQKGSFGRTRLNLRGGYIRVNNNRFRVKRKDSTNKWLQLGDCYLRERFRIIANVSANIDALSKPYNKLNKRINAEIGFYWRVSGGNTSLFAATGYYGNDPYNIYYSKSYGYFRFGLALGFFVFTNKF